MPYVPLTNGGYYMSFTIPKSKLAGGIYTMQVSSLDASNNNLINVTNPLIAPVFVDNDQTGWGIDINEITGEDKNYSFLVKKSTLESDIEVTQTTNCSVNKGIFTNYSSETLTVKFGDGSQAIVSPASYNDHMYSKGEGTYNYEISNNDGIILKEGSITFTVEN